MAVSPAASVSTPVRAAPVQWKAESAEVNPGGRDQDGDADDGGAAVRPTVNAGGQKLGQMVNVKA